MVAKGKSKARQKKISKKLQKTRLRRQANTKLASICMLLKDFKYVDINRTDKGPMIFMQLNDTVPNLCKEMSNSSTHTFNDDELFATGGWIGKQKLQLINNQIGSGSYGKIFSGTMNNQPVAIKKPIRKENHTYTFYAKNFFSEHLIHMELFCSLKSLVSATALRNAAHIPKIEFVCKYKSEGSDDPWNHIMGMERLDGDLHRWLCNTVANHWEEKKNSLVFIQMLQDICHLLIILQDTYDFHHRDFHSGNIMYQQIQTASGIQYKWYIIDFGMTTIKLQGRRYNGVIQNLYTSTTVSNYGHDLRILMLGLWDGIIDRFAESLRSYINDLRAKILRDLNTKNINVGAETLFHRGYGRAFTSAPSPITNPRNMLTELTRLKTEISALPDDPPAPPSSPSSQWYSSEESSVDDREFDSSFNTLEAILENTSPSSSASAPASAAPSAPASAAPFAPAPASAAPFAPAPAAPFAPASAPASAPSPLESVTF